MALTHEFYIARAEEAAREADKAVLENVRRRALRSEAAWRDMADRALEVANEREKALREKQWRQSQT